MRFEDLDDAAQRAILEKITAVVDNAAPAGGSPTGKMPFILIFCDANNSFHVMTQIKQLNAGAILRQCADSLDPPIHWPDVHN